MPTFNEMMPYIYTCISLSLYIQEADAIPPTHCCGLGLRAKGMFVSEKKLALGRISLDKIGQLRAWALLSNANVVVAAMSQLREMVCSAVCSCGVWE